MAMKWYVVHTYSGYETKAKMALEERFKTVARQDLLGQILIPSEDVVEMVKGAKKTTHRKFFPGYILVQMELNDETWHIVKDTPRVTGFVGGMTKSPPPIEDVEVQKIAQQISEGTLRPKPKVQFEEGEPVRVVQGPFTNFNGVVEEVNPEKGKVKVLVSIFGRATPVELDFMQVEKA